MFDGGTPMRMIAGLIAALLGLVVCTAPVSAQELLLNRSFESPVAPANGNNFYTTIANWTVTGNGQAQPANIVKPWSGYSGNPTATPTGGGSQYFDINSSDGTLRQTVTLTSAGIVDFSAWFSVRDFSQALTGLTVNIRNASNTIVATASTSFAASDPIGLWKQAAAANIPLAAGTYTFELIVPDYANVDLASMVYKPPLTTTKTSTAYSDPANGTTNPKLIPGGVAQYTITVANPGTYTVSNNSVLVADATPAGTDLVLSDIGSAGSGPAAFTAGGSALTYTFAGLGSTTDDIEFSNNNGSTWTYTPTANANGVDPAVTHVRLRPKGTMAAGSTFNFRLRYRIR